MATGKKKQQINSPARSSKPTPASGASSTAGLRKQTKKDHKEQSSRIEKLSMQDIKNLVHNLDTYQVELEMQNEELRRARQEIEDSHSRYADLYDFAPVGYFTFDGNGAVIEVNLTGAAMLGIERTKLLKTLFRPFVSKKDRDAFIIHCQKVFKTGGRQTCELELKKKDGTIFVAVLESILAEDKKVRTAMSDITKRKKAEEALNDSEQRYRGIFDSANDGIIAYDLKAGKFLFVNKRMSELTGYSEEEILKLGVKDLHPKKEVSFVLKEFDAIASGKKTGTKDIPVLMKNGMIIYCDVGSSFLGKTTLLGFFRDVTDRKLAEDRIKHLASFPQLNPNPILEVDASGTIIFANKAAGDTLEQLGLDREDPGPFLPADFNIILGGLTKRSFSYFSREVCIKDRVFDETIHVVPDFDVVRLYIQNITERKNVEVALRTSESKYRLLFENMAEGFALYELLYDAHGNPVDWRMLEANEAYTFQTGISRYTIVGRQISELYPEAIPEYLSVFAKVVATQTPVHFETYSKVSGRHLDISTFPAGGARFASTITDITKRKQTEEALIKSETKYRSLFSNMADGFALHKIVTDKTERPVDYIFLEINTAFERLTGLNKEEVIGRRVTEILPGIENDPAGWIEIYGKVALTKEECRFEQYSRQLDRWYSVSAYSPMFGFFVTLFEDITLRKQMEEELVRAKDALELRVKERTEELYEKSRILESFFKHTQTCLVFLDRDFNFIRVNEAFAKACSRDAKDIEGQNYFVDYPSDELSPKFQQVVDTKQPYSDFKRPLNFPDHPEWGTTYWDFSLAPVLDAKGAVDFLVLSLVDVTDQMQAEAQIIHLNRLYGMLSKVNTSILRIREADELYSQLCRIAVEEGGFRMAWIGLVEPITKMVVPAYSYGDTGGYLDTVTIYAADVPEGRGPSGRAIREGKNMICSDVEYDPIMQPWKDRALKQGFRSSAAIPLRKRGSVIGAFTLYADTPQFFTDEELALLTSLAENISFAIDAMYNEDIRLEAEQRIRATNELLKLFAQKYSLGEYLDEVCELVRKWSGCRHAGFRIMDKNGAIPFKASIDYDADFLKKENTLSLVHDQCICSRIIAGSPDPIDLASMTPEGSFISENTVSFTEALSGDNRSKYKGVCMRAGFKSLAIVPIRYSGQVLGVLHIADKREAALPLKKLEFIEQLAVIVGEAIYRFSAEEELIKSREELRNFSKYLREARENERTTIAREIHDELGQIITALRLDLAMLRDNYKDDNVIFNKSKSMLALVDATIQTIQNIIAELRPGILDVLGLFAAIEWQAVELKKMSGITCDLSLPYEEVVLNAEISTNIFRIIQELFTNIVRYSQATNVSVQIEIKKGRLVLKARDNGIGIKPQDISSPVSFGIIGIRERVYAMNGEIHITGTAGIGTFVNIAVPIDAGKDARPE